MLTVPLNFRLNVALSTPVRRKLFELFADIHVNLADQKMDPIGESTPHYGKAVTN